MRQHAFLSLENSQLYMLSDFHITQHVNCQSDRRLFFTHINHSSLDMSGRNELKNCFSLSLFNKKENLSVVRSHRFLSLCISSALAFVVGVFGVKQSLSSFTSTEGCQTKSGGESLLPADFARDRATNRAPGFLASNCRVPGWITMCRFGWPSPTVMPWQE